MRAMKKIGLALTLAASLAFGNAVEAAEAYEANAQLDFLSTQKDIWEKNMCLEEALVQNGEFAVTDLDNNGQLELFFTTTVGDEEFIENWGYEVNETGDGVSLLHFFNGASETDIHKPHVRMYFACQIGERHYVFESVRWIPSMEGGWARDGRLYGLQLSQGQIHQEFLGHFSEPHKGLKLPPSGETTYSDKNANIIDKEAYAKLAKNHYNGCHIYEVTLGWVSLSELWKAKGSREKVREGLAKSCAGFHAEELDEGPVH